MASSGGGSRRRKAVDPDRIHEYDFVTLVDLVRSSRKSEVVDIAFQEIERRMRPKIRQISCKFTIPGQTSSDIYQEALYALRFKAIKDYDQTRGDRSGPYPFDKFAVLCIRRHLSTRLKASYQNKQRVINSCLSLDQDRNDSSDDMLFLSDIVPSDDGAVVEALEQNEYYQSLFSDLFKRLSSFEREVFVLYARRHSYEEIAHEVSRRRSSGKGSVNVKSVDNALSRIKNKARDVVMEHGSEDTPSDPDE